jgi:hypothetical protein
MSYNLHLKKVQTGAGKQTNKTRHKGKDRPFMNQCVCLDHEKCERVFICIFIYIIIWMLQPINKTHLLF